MIRSETLTKFAPDFLKAQQSMGAALKDSKNPHFRSNFADLNSVNDASIPVLNAHSIMVLQPCVVVDGKKYIETTLLHTSGEFISALTEILSAKELSAQDQGSGITYARRYGLQALVCLKAEDDDGNKATFGNKSSSFAKNDAPAEKALSEPAGDKPKSKFQPKNKVAEAPKVEATESSDDGGWS